MSSLLGVLIARFLLATGRAAPDLAPEHQRIIRLVKPYTRTSRDRLASLVLAVDHIVRTGIAGDIVECGVWRGGSMMAVAYRLLELRDTTRTLHLYDTFTGMSAPTDRDQSITGIAASARYRRLNGRGWERASLQEVQANIATTCWPQDRTRFVTGKVEDTIPTQAPDRIALLRLDTDWYESTRHELRHLYPRLAPGGILIIDDYGHWAGAREAVDEYFADEPPFLHRVDYTARLIVKPR